MKILKLSTLLTVALYALLFTSCKDDSTSPSPEKELLPAAAGNYWVYTDAEQSFVDTVKIVSSEVINGVTFLSIYNLEHKINVIKYDGTGYYSESGTLAYKYPTFAGETITDTLSGYQISTISTNTTVSVPAGTFTAIVYEANYSDYKMRSYMTPGIGTIKVENYEKETDSSEFQLVNAFYLLSYKLY